MSVAGLLALGAGVSAAAAVVEWMTARVAERAAAALSGVPRERGPLARLAVAAGRRTGLAAPHGLAERLEAAGLDGSRVEDAMALKSGLAILAGVVAVPALGVLPGRLGFLMLLAVPAAAFLAPDLVVRRRTERRAARIARELPDTLDLLLVAIRSGLTPARAMAEVGARATGALPGELRNAGRRVGLGEPYGAVLDRLALRCPSPSVATLVAALRRAERHGAPAAPALAALAADARAERARVLREQAARAAPKIQLAVALGLVPGVLLLVAAVLVPSISA